MSSWNWSYLKTLLGFKKEYSNDDYIAIMWPCAYPAEYPAPVDPHCTIVMLGTTDVANFTKEEILDVIRQTNYNTFVFASVSGLEWFGEEKNIPVLRLDHPFLAEYKDFLERKLAEIGVYNTSSFPEYKPHVTITEDAALAGNYPLKLMLSPVQLWWGKEKISVSLR